MRLLSRFLGRLGAGQISAATFALCMVALFGLIVIAASPNNTFGRVDMVSALPSGTWLSVSAGPSVWIEPLAVWLPKGIGGAPAQGDLIFVAAIAQSQPDGASYLQAHYVSSFPLSWMHSLAEKYLDSRDINLDLVLGSAMVLIGGLCLSALSSVFTGALLLCSTWAVGHFAIANQWIALSNLHVIWFALCAGVVGLIVGFKLRDGGFFQVLQRVVALIALTGFYIAFAKLLDWPQQMAFVVLLAVAMYQPKLSIALIGGALVATAVGAKGGAIYAVLAIAVLVTTALTPSPEQTRRRQRQAIKGNGALHISELLNARKEAV